MSSFFDQLEAQLHTAAQAQTAGSWGLLRGRPGWLRTGARAVPILTALAVTVAIAVAALTIGSYAHRGTVGHKPSTTTTVPVQPSSTPSPNPPPGSIFPGFSNRLISNSDLPSFQSGGATVVDSVRTWLATEQFATRHARAAEKAMLIRNGFRAGASEHLRNGLTPGWSLVEQFRSLQAARAAMTFYDALNKQGAGGGFKSFSVPGIPGAKGLTDVTNHQVNVAFTAGPYYYLVGQAGGGAAVIAAINSAALHLYHRVG
jgi:hypothetical protein